MRRLQRIRGPVGWLHRHDVAARLLCLAAMLGFVALAGVTASHGASDPVIYAMLGLALLSGVLVVWFSIYGGDGMIF